MSVETSVSGVTCGRFYVVWLCVSANLVSAISRRRALSKYSSANKCWDLHNVFPASAKHYGLPDLCTMRLALYTPYGGGYTGVLCLSKQVLQGLLVSFLCLLAISKCESVQRDIKKKGA